MKTKIPFSQLWIEEEDYLFKQSSCLGDNSVIVEIGTAQGGSAYLFASTVKAKNISIYSYDISPSEEAFENLKNLNVNIIAKESAVGATEWSLRYGYPIDLLFIDGSHTLENVYFDFMSWFPYVKKGGKVLFHDYDPIHRGGFPHLGVRVFIDGLKKLNAMSDYEHVGRIFCGVKKEDITSDRLLEECFNAFENIGKTLIKFKTFDLTNCNYIGNEDDYLTLLIKLRGLKGNRIEPFCTALSEANVLLLPQQIPCTTTEKIFENRNIHLLDELTFFYLLNDSIRNNRDKVLEITKNRKMYFKWEELLEMHEHAHDYKGNYEEIFIVQERNVGGLSKICARELVRINILYNMFLAINGRV